MAVKQRPVIVRWVPLKGRRRKQIVAEEKASTLREAAEVANRLNMRQRFVPHSIKWHDFAETADGFLFVVR